MNHVSRRSVVRTAAWSAPAITLVTAAPAFATSGQAGVAGVTPTTSAAYVAGPVETFTAVVTTPGGAPAPTGTAVTFTLLADPSDPSAPIDWLSLHPTTTASAAVAATDADGRATVTVRYLPAVAPRVPATVRLLASGPGGTSGVTAHATLVYRAARPGTALARGARGAALSGSGGHTLAHLNGVLYAYGRTGEGQTGFGTTSPAFTPSPARVSTSGALAGVTVTAVAAGGAHSLAVGSDGRVRAWGVGDRGQLGTADGLNYSSPRAVTTTGTSLDGRTVIAVAAGQSHSIALDSSGAVHGWGFNTSGQVGDGSGTNRFSAVRLPTASTSLVGRSVVAVACGANHGVALADDGTVHTWGGNGSGELGDGTQTVRLSPVSTLPSGSSLAGRTVTAIAAGTSHNLALASDGTLHTWGFNGAGQLGRAFTSSVSTVPGQVPTTGTSLEGKNVVAIACGSVHCVVLASDGTLHAWGDNSVGQLGDGTTTGRGTPGAVDQTSTSSSLRGRTPVALVSGNVSCQVIASDGTLHAWGDNSNGQLGDGTMTNRLRPVTVNALPA